MNSIALVCIQAVNRNIQNQSVAKVLEIPKNYNCIPAILRIRSQLLPSLY